jgi:Protein of unknown function (DUF4058)
MPIHARLNQYRGVNAHLHSHFQAYGEWESFHTAFIPSLANAIDRQLPDTYLVNLEKSLQIREYHPDTGEKILVSKKPDLSIYQQASSNIPSGQAITPYPEATLTIPMVDTLLDRESYLTTLVIYKIESDHLLGKPITQLELLSPSNKVGGSGYFQYLAKREIILMAGLNLVEIDLLHETESPIPGIAKYPKDNPYPYYLTVNDPHPSLNEAQTLVYGFSVDEPFPQIQLPLADNDSLMLDITPVYHQVARSLRAFSMMVDYEQLPEQFRSYSPSDQERIRARMQAVMSASQQGFDLDNHIVPLD